MDEGGRCVGEEPRKMRDLRTCFDEGWMMGHPPMSRKLGREGIGWKGEFAVGGGGVVGMTGGDGEVAQLRLILRELSNFSCAHEFYPERL